MRSQRIAPRGGDGPGRAQAVGQALSGLGTGGGRALGAAIALLITGVCYGVTYLIGTPEAAVGASVISMVALCVALPLWFLLRSVRRARRETRAR